MQIHEKQVDVAGRPLNWQLAMPKKPAARARLLLTFYDTAKNALTLENQNLSALTFLEAGHVVASFDLPHHGSRSAAPEKKRGLHDMLAAFLDGDDPFKTFTEDCAAIIDHAHENKLADCSQVAISGVSRSGYCALRAAAADARITAIGAFAPVVDWRVLAEWKAIGSDEKYLTDPRIAAIAIEQYADALDDRDIYMAIGAHDLRVGTAAAASLAHKLLANQAAKGLSDDGSPTSPGNLSFHIDPKSPSHTLQDWYRQRGAEFLLASVAGEGVNVPGLVSACP